MYQTHIETEKTIRGLVTLNVDDEIRDVTIYIREAEGCKVKAEAQIKVSVASFFDLIEPMLNSIRNGKCYPPEAI